MNLVEQKDQAAKSDGQRILETRQRLHDSLSGTLQQLGLEGRSQIAISDFTSPAEDTPVSFDKEEFSPDELSHDTMNLDVVQSGVHEVIRQEVSRYLEHYLETA